MPRYHTSLYRTVLYREFVPSGLDEATEDDPWERDPDGEVIIIDTPDGPHEYTLAEARYLPFRLELRSASGTMVAFIPRWWDGSYEQVLSEGSTLSFTMPYDDATSVKPPNMVYLRDRYGYTVERFKIRNRVPSQQGDVRVMYVTAQSALVQLGREVVTNFEVTEAEDLTVSDVVRGLLDNYQEQDRPVSFGSITGSIGNRPCSLQVQQGTILSALRQIQESLPSDRAGVFYVNSSHRLNWKRSVGWNKGQVLSIGASARGISRDENWDKLINKLWFTGEGEDGETALNLQDAGESELYIEDTTSQATYGVCPGRHQDKRIRHPETLLLAAERYLEDHANPEYTYRVDVLNMVHAQTPGWENWIDLYLGSDVRVEADDVDLDVTLQILRIKQNLDTPLNMEVELSTRADRMGSLFEGILTKLDTPLRVMDGADKRKYPNIARIFDGTETPGEVDSAAGWGERSKHVNLGYQTGDLTGSTGDVDTATDGDASLYVYDETASTGDGAWIKVARIGDTYWKAYST